ncbi:MAG: DNA double-stranded break repair ATPase [Solivirus sp.]|uniref:DNA double-stranded break repair ATPase n=1 Tax=Solivirus sp. TaxID=2487772 RepID=A0A3G5AFI7_9VIRU|nr:MAG: DNA double-stranded break repair ATPase [Solivirus sp.]
MYKLTLKRFKSFNDRVIEIPKTNLVLLNGPSGIGKTTIFEALSFLFYDSPSYAPLNSTSTSKEETRVTLQFPEESGGLFISRSKRPNVLRVTLQNNSFYIDAAAQEFILAYFSSQNLWLCGSYISQNCLNNFFSMTANQKMEFLQEIAPSQNYEKIMSKLDLQLNQKISESTQLRITLEAIKMNYDQQLEMNRAFITGGTPWTTEQVNQMASNYGVLSAGSNYICLNNCYIVISQQLESFRKRMRASLQELQLEQSEHERMNKRRDECRTKINELNKENLEIVDCESISKERFELIRKIEIRKINSEKETCTRRCLEIEERLKSIGEIKEFDQNILKYEWVFEQERDKVKKEYELAKSQLEGMDYNQLKVDIESLQEAICYMLSCNYRTTKLELETSKTYCTNYLPEFTNIDSISTAIGIIEKSLGKGEQRNLKFNCPTCFCDLMIDGDHLIRYSSSPPTDLQLLKNELSQLQNKKMALKRLEENSRKMKEIEEKCRENRVDLSIEYRKILLGETNLETLRKQIEEKEIKLKNHTGAKNYKEGEPIQNWRDKISFYERYYLAYSSISSDWSLELCQKTRIEMNRAVAKDALSSELKRCRERLESIQKIEKTESSDEIEELEKKLKEVEERLKQGEEQNKRRETIRLQIDFYTKEMNSLPETTDQTQTQKIAELQKNLEEREEQYRNLLNTTSVQIRLAYLMEIYNSYTEKMREYEMNTKQITQLNKIKSVLITSQYVIIDSVLSKLNAIIENILASLFDVPITVTLCALRQLKTSDRVKPEINVQIFYQGSEFSKLNTLSGGEQLRISLALTIAFSKLSKSKFMLLDECLSCLDNDSKEKALRVIREYVQDKTVLIVNHDSVEAPYDSVIKL